MTETFTDGAKAFARARHIQRFAHTECLVWKDKAGTWHVARNNAAATKAAMLACGTSGRWTCISARGVGYVQTWRMAVTELRNAPYLEACT